MNLLLLGTLGYFLEKYTIRINTIYFVQLRHHQEINDLYKIFLIAQNIAIEFHEWLKEVKINWVLRNYSLNSKFVFYLSCLFQHTLIVADPANLIDAPVIIGKRNVAPLLYQGTGLIADVENPLVLQVLTASSSAYSYIPEQQIKEVIQISYWQFMV
jgi:hypothetical protein